MALLLRPVTWGGVLDAPTSGSPLAGRTPGRDPTVTLTPGYERTQRVPSRERAWAGAQAAAEATASRTSVTRSLLLDLSMGYRSLHDWWSAKNETLLPGGETRQRDSILNEGTSFAARGSIRLSPPTVNKLYAWSPS